jgi:nucleotide-binding universal stress UspA family protein
MAHETIRIILVPTDFSEGADRALGWARILARAFRAEIVVLHVVDLGVAWVPLGGLGAVPAPVPHDFVERFTESAQAALDAVAEGASEVTRRLLRHGHPREVILEVAKEVHADVITMGTHGRRGFSQLFIGSVAEHVVRHAPVPVVTVRQPES